MESLTNEPEPTAEPSLDRQTTKRAGPRCQVCAVPIAQDSPAFFKVGAGGTVGSARQALGSLPLPWQPARRHPGRAGATRMCGIPVQALCPIPANPPLCACSGTCGSPASCFFWPVQSAAQARSDAFHPLPRLLALPCSATASAAHMPPPRRWSARACPAVSASRCRGVLLGACMCVAAMC